MDPRQDEKRNFGSSLCPNYSKICQRSMLQPLPPIPGKEGYETLIIFCWDQGFKIVTENSRLLSRLRHSKYITAPLHMRKTGSCKTLVNLFGINGMNITVFRFISRQERQSRMNKGGWIWLESKNQNCAVRFGHNIVIFQRIVQFPRWVQIIVRSELMFYSNNVGNKATDYDKTCDQNFKST